MFTIILKDLSRRAIVSSFICSNGIQELHTGCPCLSNVSVHREARMLKKFMTGSNRPKKKFFTVDQSPGRQFKEMQFLDNFDQRHRKGGGKAGRRAVVLNVVFTEKVTSILSTGEVGDGIMELGVFITKIKISPDFSKLQIFWDAPTNSECPTEEIQARLDKVSGRLRHVLITLRVIGLVPPIEFVRDLVSERMSRIENALKNVGHSLEPDDPSLSPVNYEQLELDAGKKKRKSKFVDEDEEEILEESVDVILKGPEMSNSILGIDHVRIMSRIKESVKKSAKKKLAGVQQKPEGITDDTDNVAHENAEDYDPTRVKSFTQYLEKQRKDKLKLLKLQSAAVLERDLHLMEQYERARALEDSMLSSKSENEQDDYLDDDYERTDEYSSLK